MKIKENNRTVKTGKRKEREKTPQNQIANKSFYHNSKHIIMLLLLNQSFLPLIIVLCLPAAATAAWYRPLSRVVTTTV